MKKHRLQHDSGLALVMALLFVSIALFSLALLSTRLIAENKMVDHFQIYNSTFEGLESGLAMATVELEGFEDGVVGLTVDWIPTWEGNTLVLPGIDDEGVEAIGMVAMADVRFFAYTVDWGTDGRDSNGDGIVDSAEEQGIVSLYVVANNGNVTRTVEAVNELADINVWNNAIFAGAGQAGGLISGNVSIHGAVHLLGEALVEGGVAIAALDLSGTSMIHNNYEGMPGGLAARIPALPTDLIDGELLSTLDAKLRVKNGLVGMSGNSEVGQANDENNSLKELMNGTFVNDGWTGNSVTPDAEGRGDPQSVFSDNGWDERYDAGDKVNFPMLDDDWRDPVDGSTIMNDFTGENYTHEEYFSEVLVADEDVVDDGIYNGDITFNVRNGDAFYYNATTGEELSGDDALAATPGATDDFIQFDPDNNTLRINGQLRINGDVTFEGQGNDQTVHYTGRASLMVYGDVDIETDLLTYNYNAADPSDTSDTSNSFPVKNILGIMSSQNMAVGGTAQREIMGAFYAQEKITSDKQNKIVGTFVSNYFDMGGQVPSIYQVPQLSTNLPEGMIGNFPILTLSRLSWRELGL